MVTHSSDAWLGHSAQPAVYGNVRNCNYSRVRKYTVIDSAVTVNNSPHDFEFSSIPFTKQQIPFVEVVALALH